MQLLLESGADIELKYVVTFCPLPPPHTHTHVHVHVHAHTPTHTHVHTHTHTRDKEHGYTALMQASVEGDEIIVDVLVACVSELSRYQECIIPLLMIDSQATPFFSDWTGVGEKGLVTLGYSFCLYQNLDRVYS